MADRRRLMHHPSSMGSGNNSDGSADALKEPAVHKGEFVLYGRRWLMLANIALLQAANAILWVSYAAVATKAAQYFDTDNDTINMLSITYMVVYIIVGFWTTMLLQRTGLRYALVLASGVNMVGAVIRYVGVLGGSAKQQLILQFMGQTFGAIAQPFLLGCTTLLAATWFGEHERAIANSLSSLANPIGTAAGYILVTWSFLQARPPTPPSRGSVHLEHDTFVGGLRKVASSKQYLLLFLSFGIGVGIFNALTTLMNQIIMAQGYTATMAGYCSAALIGSGILGAIVAGVVLDITQYFVSVIKVVFASATASFAFFAIVNRPGQATLLTVASGLAGFFSFAVLPTALELGVEITYPVSEATSSGFLWLSGQLFGILFIVGMNAMKGYTLEALVIGGNKTAYHAITRFPNGTIESDTVYDNMEAATWGVCFCGALATVLIMLLYTRYKRIEAEAADEGADVTISITEAINAAAAGRIAGTRSAQSYTDSETEDDELEALLIAERSTLQQYAHVEVIDTSVSAAITRFTPHSLVYRREHSGQSSACNSPMNTGGH